MISSYQLPAPRGSQTFRDLHRFFTVLRCLGIFGGVPPLHGWRKWWRWTGNPPKFSSSERHIRRDSKAQLCGVSPVFLGLAWSSSIWVVNPSPSWIFIKWQLVWFMGKRYWFWICYVVRKSFFWVKPSGELAHHYLSFVEGVQKVLSSYKARLTKYHVMDSAECGWAFRS